MSRTLGLTLDGVSPGELDACIHVTDIMEEQPVIHRSTAECTGGGTLVLHEKRVALTVRVRLSIRERSMERRCLLLERLNGWACGSELRLDHRPGRRLTVRCSARPGMVSAQNWAQDVEYAFTAWAVPWWEDTMPVRLTLTEGSTADWFVCGTAAAPVSFRAECTGGLCTRVEVRVGESSMAFTGLQLTSGDALEAICGTDDMPALTVTPAGGAAESAHGLRTAASDDLLTVRCGQTQHVSVLADAPVSVTLTARGRYL